MRVLAVLLAGAVVVASAAAGAQPRQATSASAPLDVPYVSQGELLCGGAAAAMLLRYWGARGVYAEDFAPLVDSAAGGISTSTLASAVRRKGWRTIALSGSADKVRRALDRGEPAIALIQDRPGRYHYVVIVSWRNGSVVYHDPARGPLQSRDAAAFERSWEAAKRWAIAVLPGETRATERTGSQGSIGSLGSTGSGSTGSGSTGSTGSGSTGSTGSNSNDSMGSTVSGPMHSSAVDADGTDEAMVAFERQDYGAAARAAGERVRRHPEDSEAWRILGASLYLDSRKADALDAWNHIGEPRVDLVTFDGLRRTPYRAVERLAGIDARDVLTARQLRRGDRRLGLLPAADSASLTYTALPGGLVEVTGAIVEEPRTPRLAELLVQAVKLPFTRQVSLGFGSPFNRGGHWNAMWRFQPGRPAVRLGVDLPAGPLPGIWSIDAGWETNTFQIGTSAETSTTRRDGRLGWTDWIAADTKFSAGAGLARWKDRGTYAILDAAVQQRVWSDHIAFGVGVSGAPGATPFGTTVAHLAWRTGGKPLRLVGSLVSSRASARAPIDLWPYAGAGSGRELLLRGHDLREGGTLVSEVYGRVVNVGTIEAQRDVYARGPAALAIAAFTDMGRIDQRADLSTSSFQVDVGVGLRIRTGIGDRAVRIDLARALRDGGVVLSAGYDVSWFDRKVRR